MNTAFLQEIGLTKSQSVAYAALIKNSPCAPPALAKIVNESRTNIYKILDGLEELGLVTRDESTKKIRYIANSPTALNDITARKKREAEAAAKKLEAALPELMNQYFEYSIQPSVSYFVGKEGIGHVYADQIKTGEPITMVRSQADINFFGSFGAMSSIRHTFNTSPISRHMITPDTVESNIHWLANDTKRGNTRTWLRHDDYTAAVEWAVYSNKLAIISFDKEAIGMIIESKQVAEGFRQLLKLVDDGSRLKSDYARLPTKASRTEKSI